MKRKVSQMQKEIKKENQIIYFLVKMAKADLSWFKINIRL